MRRGEPAGQFSALAQAEWHEINQDYWVMRGLSCTGIARLVDNSYVASISSDVGSRVRSADIGRFRKLSDAKNAVEASLRQSLQIGSRRVLGKSEMQHFPLQPAPLF